MRLCRGHADAPVATGLVAATHLAGGSLNLNPHQHVIGLDGVYSTSTDGEHVVFTPTRAPSQSELRDAVGRVDKRVTRWLVHCGHHDDEHHDPDPSPEQASNYIDWHTLLERLRHRFARVSERWASLHRRAHRAGADSSDSRVDGSAVHAASAGAPGTRHASRTRSSRTATWRSFSLSELVTRMPGLVRCEMLTVGT